MAVRGCTFHLQTMTSKDWAHQISNFQGDVTGITKGCEVSVRADGDIGITAGYFYVYGRLLEEDGTSIIPVPLVTSTTYRVLVYELDMKKENTKTSFNQGAFRILSATGAYPMLVQEDLDNGGSIYQFQLASWKQEVSGITSFSPAKSNAKKEFVVEYGEGTNGRYRKWNSGVLDIWGKTTVSTPQTLYPSGAIFCAPVAFNLPIASLTPVEVNVNAPNNFGAWVELSAATNLLSTVGIYAYRVVQGGFSVEVHYQAKGTWK